MSPNPYQPPGTEKSRETPSRWKQICYWGLTTAIVAFAALFVLAILKPIDTGDSEPPTVTLTRRVMAALMLLLWLVIVAGLIAVIRGGIGYATSRREQS